MNKLIINLLILATAMMGLTACESDAERQARLEREHEIKMAKIQAGMNPDRTVVYTNHGYRTSGGLYNDPYYDNIYAHRNSYAENLALAATIGYVASAFTPSYEPRSTVVVVNGRQETQYLDKSGKTISKSEYDRRKAQSAKDKAAHQAKEKERLKKWKSDPKNASKFKAKDKASRDAKAKKASAKKPKTSTKAKNTSQTVKKDDKSKKTSATAPVKKKTDFAAKREAEAKAKKDRALKAKQDAAKKEAARKAYLKKQAQQKKAKKSSSGWGSSSKKSYSSSKKKR